MSSTWDCLPGSRRGGGGEGGGAHHRRASWGLWVPSRGFTRTEPSGEQGPTSRWDTQAPAGGPEGVAVNVSQTKDLGARGTAVFGPFPHPSLERSFGGDRSFQKLQAPPGPERSFRRSGDRARAVRTRGCRGAGLTPQLAPPPGLSLCHPGATAGVPTDATSCQAPTSGRVADTQDPRCPRGAT